MELKYEIINDNYYNIKDVLKSYFEISDRLLTKLKKSNKIFLNGKTQFIDHLVTKHDIITVNLDFNEDDNKNILPIKMNLDILFEDDGLLILNKKPGIAIHPSILHFDDTLSNGVKYYFNNKNLKKKIRPVNRLDKDTSGIVIFAKNEYIQESLIRQMKNNQFKKEYLAILTGHLKKLSGTINAPISRKENSIIEREINSTGEVAITHFELQNNFVYKKQNLCLVKFVLETGRTHQIRLHSKHILHPILGDSLYGLSSELITRQALHAYRINFIHPITKKQIIIETNLPEDMNKIIEKLE